MAESLEERHGKATRLTLRTPLFVTAAVLIAFAASRLAIVGVATEREYDEGVYLLSARAVLAGHALFTSVFSSQPPAFLESLVVAMRVFGDSIETARVVILAFALVSLAAIASIARRVAGPWAAPAAAAALALSATFGDLSHLVEAESPAIAVALCAVCACLESRRRGWHRGWLLASGALLALGVLFKILVAPMAAPLGLLLFLAPASEDETDWQMDGRGLGLLGRVLQRSLLVAAGALAVGLVPFLVYDPRALYEQTIAFHLAKHGAYRVTPFGNLHRAANHLIADGPLTATAVAGAALLTVRKRLALAWLVVWMLVMLAIVAAQTPLFWRHFVLLSPPLVIAAAAAAPVAAGFLRRSRALVPALATIATIAIWIAVTVGRSGHRGDAAFPLLPGPAKENQRVEYLHEVTDWIRDNTQPDEAVVGDDPIAIYMAGRSTVPALCDTSGARILSGSLTLEAATRESAGARVIVLRQPGRLTSLHGYVAWLRANYDQMPAATTGVESRRTVWIRKEGNSGTAAPAPEAAVQTGAETRRSRKETIAAKHRM